MPHLFPIINHSLHFLVFINPIKRCSKSKLFLKGPKCKCDQVQLSAWRSDWSAVGSSPIASSALSFLNSSKVMKRCLRRWSTRSWTWYSCFCPSIVWKSSTSTPRTVKVSYHWTSPSWPTMYPWPSCFSELGPRRVPTVSKRSLFLFVFGTHPVHRFAVVMCLTFQTPQKVFYGCFYLHRCAILKMTPVKRITQPQISAYYKSAEAFSRKLSFIVWYSNQWSLIWYVECQILLQCIPVADFTWTELNIYFPLHFPLAWIKYGCHAMKCQVLKF